jgi:hypothetical protein
MPGVWAEKLRCGGFIGFRVRNLRVIILPDLGHLPKTWQTRSLRSPEATAPLSHHVSQMSGDEAKIKPA